MPRRNDHTRQEIQHMAIQAAISILTRDGINGLSTRKVAKQIGYTVGTLYLVFENLDELILHVNAATLDELHSVLVKEVDTTRTAQLQLNGLSHAYLAFARHNFARWTLLFSHRLPEGVALPDWFTGKIERLFALVAGPLQALRPGLDTIAYQQATYVLWSSVHGVCELALNEKLSLGGNMQPEALLDAVLRNYLHGFLRGGD